MSTIIIMNPEDMAPIMESIPLIPELLKGKCVLSGLDVFSVGGLPRGTFFVTDTHCLMDIMIGVEAATKILYTILARRLP